MSGIGMIITALIVSVVIGLMIGAIILIVLAVKKHVTQNNVTEKYCVNCGARIEQGLSFCTQCGAAVTEQEPIEESTDFRDIKQ